jgi:hypothetical protein
MTRKDYVLIAQAIRTQIDFSAKFEEEESRAGAQNIAYDLAWKLYEDNPRFDRKRFLEACGVVGI